MLQQCRAKFQSLTEMGRQTTSDILLCFRVDVREFWSELRASTKVIIGGGTSQQRHFSNHTTFLHFTQLTFHCNHLIIPVSSHFKKPLTCCQFREHYDHHLALCERHVVLSLQTSVKGLTHLQPWIK